MSLQSTDLNRQAAAMRIVADLTERAVAFGARTTPLWSFYSTGTVNAHFPMDETPNEAEMSAWRLALGGIVSVSAMTYQSKAHDRTVRSEDMSVMYEGIRVEITTVRPIDAVQVVEA